MACERLLAPRSPTRVEFRRARRSHTGEGPLGEEDGLPPVDAENPLTMRLKQALALDIVGAGDWVVMPCAAVSLDHEALRRPAEVRDHEPRAKPDGDVDVGALESTVEQEVEHHVLELRL